MRPSRCSSSRAASSDLNAPVAKYLGGQPWFSRLPNARDITARMLMTHTIGLVRYEMNPTFTADLRAQPDKTWTLEEEIAYLLDADPPFEAGKAGTTPSPTTSCSA